MPPAKRKHDKHLPQNVYFKHGAYFYVKKTDDKKRKWIRLSESLSDAMKQWSDLINDPIKIFTMSQLFDRYMIDVAPTKSAASYKQNQIQMQNLRIFFGGMYPKDVNPVNIYKYLDIRSRKSKVAPNREKSLLSHVFTMAIRWGVVNDNPCRNVKRLTERPRNRYVTDQEFFSVRNIAPEKLKLIMDFAYLTGQRISDVLKIKISDLDDEGIKIEQNKTGKKLLILWSDELKDCVNNARKLPRSNLYSITLFCNRRGQQMTYDSFKSIWQKTIKKALEQNLIKEIFTFHDIRAKAASDAKNVTHASELLGHSSESLTKKVYIRKPVKIIPLQ